jgi:hypothetical protein
MYLEHFVLLPQHKLTSSIKESSDGILNSYLHCQKIAGNIRSYAGSVSRFSDHIGQNAIKRIDLRATIMFGSLIATLQTFQFKSDFYLRR